MNRTLHPRTARLIGNQHLTGGLTLRTVTLRSDRGGRTLRASTVGVFRRPAGSPRWLGARRRSIRQQQGLSLQGVEEKSNGRWKAVVVGSYERGDRAVTVSRLAGLAHLHRGPGSETRH